MFQMADGSGRWKLKGSLRTVHKNIPSGVQLFLTRLKGFHIICPKMFLQYCALSIRK